MASSLFYIHRSGCTLRKTGPSVSIHLAPVIDHDIEEIVFLFDPAFTDGKLVSESDINHDGIMHEHH
jgi:hypothetical protein